MLFGLTTNTFTSQHNFRQHSIYRSTHKKDIVKQSEAEALMEGQAVVPKLPEEDARNWCYRGEGAANIVLAYQGSHPLLVGKVLRLKKEILDGKHVKKSEVVCSSGRPVLTEEEQKIWAHWPSIAQATRIENLIHAYARDVMGPLLGSELVDPGVVIRVSNKFLEGVACSVQHARASWRANTSQIDIRSSCALLISDHSLFRPLPGAEQGESIYPSISVEVKPKCGFLPSSAFIAAENSIKKKVSRFTMHQHLKLSEGQVEALSYYSPLDLFSENLEKINQAVHNLFNNPQNNLRVFVGGCLFDMTMSNLNMESVSWQALREVLKSCICSENEADPVEVLKGLVAQSLYETDALKNLLAAQKLDIYDIEGAIHAYYKLWDGRPAECLNRGIMSAWDGSINHKAGDILDGKTIAECRRIVRDYLIAATAKDCSVMLTFQQAPDAVVEIANMHCYKVVCSSKIDKFFRLKMNFVDLDLKPLSKMPHYLQIDQEIVRAYLTATHGGTKCCEAQVNS